MNFAIFDEDFAKDKENYLKELKELEKNVIAPEYNKKWKVFVKEHLIDTRNFYLLKTALKVIKNLKEKLDYDTAMFSALSFLPDQTFLETVIMLVARFSEFEKEFAQHFNVDVTFILKNKIKEKQTEKKLIFLKSEKLVPVEVHLKNFSFKKNKSNKKV